MLVELVLSPLLVAGGIAYLFRLKRYNQPKGISGTAYEPFFIRAMAHGIGARRDVSAHRLASVLPALSPLTWWLLMWPIRVGCRIARYKPAMIAGSTHRPVKYMQVMALRTNFFDETLHDAISLVDQVVILGAGWDTRAYEQLKGANVRIFEVDTPVTQRVKIQALAAAGIDSSHVTFVETDFNQTSWLDAIQHHGFNPALKTYVLWEGVTMYLSEDAVRATLKNVSSLATGSMIAIDYFAHDLIKGVGRYKLIGAYMNLGIKLTYGESLIFGIPMRPNAQQAAADYLAGCGLTLQQFDMIGEDGKWTALYGFALAVNPPSH